MDRESIVSLGKDINEQADWLIQLVENILNMFARTRDNQEFIHMVKKNRIL